MINVFLDANVLVAVLNKEFPVFTHASRILSLADNKRFELYTTPICLAIAFYFVEKKQGSQAAKRKIDLLVRHIRIAENKKESVAETLANRQIEDFEDGLEYYAALSSRCHCIVTEDGNDFYFSDINVFTSREFWNHYFVKK